MTEYQALLNAGATHAEAIEQLRIANRPTGLNMAGATTAALAKTNKSVKAKPVPPTLVERVKAQLSAATLKNKISVDELGALEAHIGMLKSVLS